MKTLQECKDEVCLRKHNHYFIMRHRRSIDELMAITDEAAELYASQFIEPYSPTVKEYPCKCSGTVSMKMCTDTTCVNPPVKESETGANWQKERENAELTRTNAQLDEMVTKYNELSKKYDDLYTKYYSQ